MSEQSHLSRRTFLRLSALGASALVAACAPKIIRETVIVEKAVEKVVKETVFVEKEVEKIVKEVVKETVVVEKEVEKVVEIAVTPEPEPELEGTIVINMGGSDTQTWENLALAYEAMHPGVDVRVELKPGEGYQEWIQAQFAAGTPETSLLAINQVASLIQAKKFIDWAPYLDRISPYTGKPWREDIEEAAIANMTDPLEATIYSMNLETVQVLWFYNERIFEEVGITDIPSQPTWEEFIGWCEKFKDAGYIPVAIEGDFTAFWSMRVGWIHRIYADQYTRNEAELVRCQPGDYCYREGIDDKWEYDPTDPWNDENNRVTFNTVRQMNAFYEGKQRVDTPCWKEMYENLSQLLGPMTEPGWIGTKDAMPLFLTQKAAIWLDGAWFFTTFEKQIKELAEGTYGVKEGEPTPTPVAGAERAEVFEIGTFNNPSMTGACVDGSKARTIEVNIGFWGIPKKDAAQNDLEVDFVMFVTSPQGYGIYLRNKLDMSNLQGGISGPPVVKHAVLPALYEQRFASVKLIGNTQKPNAGKYRSRGIGDYQPMVRDWVDLSQQYYGGKITVDEYTAAYQKSMEDQFEVLLTDHYRWADGLKALEHPEKKPETID